MQDWNCDGAQRENSRNDKLQCEKTHEEDIDALIALLDQYAMSGGSRMKINVVEGQGEVVSRQYHHGRCDVGSPWARGQAFDVLEDSEHENTNL